MRKKRIGEYKKMRREYERKSSRNRWKRIEIIKSKLKIRNRKLIVTHIR